MVQNDTGSEFYKLGYWILVLVAKCSNIPQDKVDVRQIVNFKVVSNQNEAAYFRIPHLLDNL